MSAALGGAAEAPVGAAGSDSARSPTLTPALSRREREKRWPALGAALLLAAQAGLLAWGAYVHSPVYDETAHLPAGISWWALGRTDLYPHNPLLVKVIAAAPVALVGANFKWDAADEHPLRRPEFKVGRDFAQANGRRTFWLFTLARWACIPFATLAGVVIFLWSRTLYGPLAGLGSLALWCFGPNVLANAQLIVPDAAATAFMLASAYTFRGWLLGPHVGSAVVRDLGGRSPALRRAEGAWRTSCGLAACLIRALNEATGLTGLALPCDLGDKCKQRLQEHFEPSAKSESGEGCRQSWIRRKAPWRATP